MCDPPYAQGLARLVQRLLLRGPFQSPIFKTADERDVEFVKAVMQEVSRMDLEFLSNKMNDACRLDQLQRSIVPSDHPFNRFTAGNAKSLLEKAPKEKPLGLSVVEFYHQYYASTITSTIQ